MNYSPNKSRPRSPTQGIISLLVTVILLATVLQPCVMASVIDSSSSAVETHQMNHTDDASNPGDHGCPHCETLGCDDDHCGSQTSESCDTDNPYVHSGRIKPIDHEKFYSTHPPLKLLNSPEGEIQSGQVVASEVDRYPPNFQGPSLTDLYRVYLK